MARMDISNLASFENTKDSIIKTLKEAGIVRNAEEQKVVRFELLYCKTAIQIENAVQDLFERNYSSVEEWAKARSFRREQSVLYNKIMKGG